MVRWTTGDVCDLTGIGRFRLHTWCSNKIVEATQNGKGGGNHRVFNNVQVVAITYAYRYVDMGYSLQLAKKIVSFICSHSEPELLAEFEAGRTHLLPCGDLPMQLIEDPDPIGKTCEILDVEKIYKQCISYAEQAKDDQRSSKQGRSRGLANS